MNGQPIIPREDTGRVYITDDKLYWEVENTNLLEISIPAIRAIGEYTTMHARFRNEWFLVFVLDGGETSQISAYAEGMNDVISQLSAILSSELRPGLALATDFKSNVIWPPQLTGQELYELKIKEAKTWFDRFRARLGFGDPVELVLKNSVKELL